MSNFKARLKKIGSFCISLFSIVMIKNMTTSNWKRKGINCLTLVHLIPSWREVRVGIPEGTWRAETEAGHGGTQLAPNDLLCLFSYTTQGHPSMVPTVISLLELPHLSVINKCSLRLSYE